MNVRERMIPMSNIYSDNSQALSSAPLRYLHITESLKTTGQATFEGSISAYMTNCRTTVNFIKDAEERGILKSGMKIIEPAFDYTGLALAYVAANRGYHLTLTIPETSNIDCRMVLSALGANLILTASAEGLKGAIKRAEEIVSAEPHRYFLPHKFKSQGITKIYIGTAEPEIGIDARGTIQVSISEVGTSDTMSGVSSYTQHIKGKKSDAVSKTQKNIHYFGTSYMTSAEHFG